jgi:hypothetical protein
MVEDFAASSAVTESESVPPLTTGNAFMHPADVDLFEEAMIMPRRSCVFKVKSCLTSAFAAC